MLHLFTAARLDRLADALADVLLVPPAPGADPLAAEWVVVGARPAERWLTAHLALRLGVCAHVHFLSPTSLVERVVSLCTGVPTEATRAWHADALLWRVLRALPALLDDAAAAPDLAGVRRYLAPDGAPLDAGAARTLAFARRVAECLARYGTVAPEWDAAWSGDDAAAAPAGLEAAWQRHLWRALRADGAPPPLAAQVDEAVARLRRGDLPAGLPRRLGWLAPPAIAPLHARVAAELARAGVAVQVLAPVPSHRAWWQPAEASAAPVPPLLRSLGRLAEDGAQVLEEACARAGVTPVRRALADDAVAPDAPLPALARLRADLVEGRARGPGAAPPLPLAAGDASLAFHACHGPMRQAEVLRDQLLAAFAADPTLQPRDVLVLAPDVATFGPLVEAAFGVTAGAAPIPVRVLDRPARRANVAADVALRLLALADARVDAVQVLDLLAVPAVAARFDLAPADEEALRRWVRESSVRWGLDAADRADRHGLPAEREHTWEFGLDRLLLGWGMPGDGHLLFADALPYDEVEGSDAERLGRFAEGCQAVFDAVRALRAAHPLAVWGERLAAHAEALLVRPPRAGRRPRPDPALAVALRDLRGALDALVEHAGGFDAPLSLAAVRLLLEQRFDEPAPGAGAAGAVTMARLVPGRVVPARVVALLGLDEATFPRRRGGAGFDLLATTPRPGCADAPAEDRLRVLEALLAAGDRLLVLYTGRTVDTNEPVAPAVPVGELLDAVDATFVRADGATDRDGQALPARTLVEWHHALQPFSPRAFEQGAPASHDRLQLAGARALRDARRTPPPFLGRPLAEPAPDERDADAFASTDAGAPVVTVHELADFLARPAKALVAGRLGVWYDEEPELEVADPLVLDALARWALRDDLVQRLLAHAGDDVDDALPALRDGLLPRLRARGALPHGPLGTVTFQALHAEARAVVVPVRAQRASCACPQAEVDATLGAWRLRGAVGAVWRGGDGSWGPGLREATAGTVDAKRLAGFWVRHLALHLAPALDGAAPTSVLVGKPGREPHVVVLGPVADARACLERLLALRDRGLRHPVAYAPAASLAYADRRRALGPDGDVEEAREAASRAWRPEGGGGAWSRAEGDDAYAARLFGDADLARLPDFEATALAVWEPCLAVRTLRKA